MADVLMTPARTDRRGHCRRRIFDSCVFPGITRPSPKFHTGRDILVLIGVVRLQNDAQNIASSDEPRARISTDRVFRWRGANTRPT
jgi:hypothetical protein